MKLEFVKLGKKLLNEQDQSNVQQRPNVPSSAPGSPYMAAPPMAGATTAAQAILAGRGTSLRDYSNPITDPNARRSARNQAYETNKAARDVAMDQIRGTSSPKPTSPAQRAAIRSTVIQSGTNRQYNQNLHGSGGRQNPNVAPNTQAQAPAAGSTSKSTPNQNIQSAPNKQAKPPSPAGSNYDTMDAGSQNVRRYEPVSATPNSQASAPQAANTRRTPMTPYDNMSVPGVDAARIQARTDYFTQVSGIKPGQYQAARRYFRGPEDIDQQVDAAMAGMMDRLGRAGEQAAERVDRRSDEALADVEDLAQKGPPTPGGISRSIEDLENVEFTPTGTRSGELDISGSETIQTGVEAADAIKDRINRYKEDLTDVGETAGTGLVSDIVDDFDRGKLVEPGDAGDIARDYITDGREGAAIEQGQRILDRAEAEGRQSLSKTRNNIRNAIISAGQTPERRARLGLGGVGDEGYISQADFTAYERLARGMSVVNPDNPSDNARRLGIKLPPRQVTSQDIDAMLAAKAAGHMTQGELQNFTRPYADAQMQFQDAVGQYVDPGMPVTVGDVVRYGDTRAMQSIRNITAEPSLSGGFAIPLPNQLPAAVRNVFGTASNPYTGAQHSHEIDLLNPFTAATVATGGSGRALTAAGKGALAATGVLPTAGRVAGQGAAAALSGGATVAAPLVKSRVIPAAVQSATNMGMNPATAAALGQTAARFTPGGRVGTGGVLYLSGAAALDDATRTGADLIQRETGIELTQPDVARLAASSIPGAENIPGLNPTVNVTQDEFNAVVGSKEFRDAALQQGAKLADPTALVGGLPVAVANQFLGTDLTPGIPGYQQAVINQAERMLGPRFQNPTDPKAYAQMGSGASAMGINAVGMLGPEQISQIEQQGSSNPLYNLIFDENGQRRSDEEFQRRAQAFQGTVRQTAQETNNLIDFGQQVQAREDEIEAAGERIVGSLDEPEFSADRDRISGDIGNLDQEELLGGIEDLENIEGIDTSTFERIIDAGQERTEGARQRATDAIEDNRSIIDQAIETGQNMVGPERPTRRKMRQSVQQGRDAVQQYGPLVGNLAGGVAGSQAMNRLTDGTPGAGLVGGSVGGEVGRRAGSGAAFVSSADPQDIIKNLPSMDQERFELIRDNVRGRIKNGGLHQNILDIIKGNM